MINEIWNSDMRRIKLRTSISERFHDACDQIWFSTRGKKCYFYYFLDLYVQKDTSWMLFLYLGSFFCEILCLVNGSYGIPD